jgi:hypothetical protein
MEARTYEWTITVDSRDGSQSVERSGKSESPAGVATDTTKAIADLCTELETQRETELETSADDE